MLDPVRKQSRLFKERSALRSLLRVLVIWSRQRRVNGQDLSLSYSRGMLDFI